MLLPGKRVEGGISLTPPGIFKRGAVLTVEVTAPGRMTAARLHYRRVNQAETWRVADMDGKPGHWSAAIPAEYTDSAFPLEYYFELHEGPKTARLYPGPGREFDGTAVFCGAAGVEAGRLSGRLQIAEEWVNVDLFRGISQIADLNRISI